METSRQPTEMTQDELLAQALHLSEHRAQTYLTPERKEQLSTQLNRILFEVHYRDGSYQDDNDAA